MVDAVLTWVDGQDEAHINKRLNCLKALPQKVSEEELAERFHASNEIDYCLQSLLRFAPWLNKIYIVTDAQTPPVLKTLNDERIVVVDHQVIFKGYEQYLPTFNSLTIESMLWRIPGLSNQFIYLNDDCMLLRPRKKEDFFKAGKPVLGGQFKLQSAYKPWQRKKPAPHCVFQENSARLVGFNKRFIHLPHAPFPLLKKTFEDFFSTHEATLHESLKYPLRDLNQFWSISLAYHLYQREKQVIWNNHLKAMHINATHHSLKKIQAKLRNMKQNKRMAFACVQNLSQGTPEVQDFLNQWFSEWIGCDL